MYFAHRTKQRMRAAAAVAVVYCIVAAAVALIFRRESTSYVYSFAVSLVGIPVVLTMLALLEWSGNALLSLPFWKRMPSWARVALLVAVVLAVSVAVAFAASEFKARGAL
jgi:hypothetical protein